MLPAIIAHARSGSLGHAWRLFRAAGFAEITDDPAVLTLKGRLIKDQAAGADPVERRRLLLEAVGAYGAAGAISDASYPLINAATLALLAGDPGQAKARAVQLLTRLDAAGDDPDETPYYALATRAEALLLVGETAAARAALEGAVALAPRAWEDHASTLRQFSLILAEIGEDAGWLEALRPPRCLHFGGGMGLAGDDAAARSAIEGWLTKARIGFGYGALAAGADILIAEGLVAAGAELHVILPCSVEDFRRASVRPYGGDWEGRFEALIAACASLHIAGSACPDADEPVAPQSLQLAAEVAMGRAVMQASVLATSAAQLLVLSDAAAADGPAGGSVWMREAWRGAGRAGEVIALPIAVEPEAKAATATINVCDLAALVWMESTSGELDSDLLARMAATVSADLSPVRPPRWSGAALVLAFDRPALAAAYALGAVAALGEAVRIGAAYDLVQSTDDPFGGAPLLLGPASDLASRASLSTPAGAVHVTGDFAAALYAGPEASRPRTEYVGDLPGLDVEDPVQLHALKPRG